MAEQGRPGSAASKGGDDGGLLTQRLESKSGEERMSARASDELLACGIIASATLDGAAAWQRCR